MGGFRSVVKIIALLVALSGAPAAHAQFAVVDVGAIAQLVAAGAHVAGPVGRQRAIS